MNSPPATFLHKCLSRSTELAGRLSPLFVLSLGTTVLICAALLLFLPGCVMGIPDALPPVPKPKECKVHLTVDGKYKGCMDNEEFQRWRKAMDL